MKTLAKITRRAGNGELIETIEAFESENHYLLFTGNMREEIVGGKILSADEVKKHLELLQEMVIAADLRKAEAKDILDNIKRANKALFDIVGAGYYFQDEYGTVYKTDTCDGKFVYFEPVEIKRTRREGETKGSLSMTEARAAGFEVEGK
jgi:hypothetical protein